jgi:hypothetical protein
MDISLFGRLTSNIQAYSVLAPEFVHHIVLNKTRSKKSQCFSCPRPRLEVLLNTHNDGKRLTYYGSSDVVCADGSVDLAKTSF